MNARQSGRDIRHWRTPNFKRKSYRRPMEWRVPHWLRVGSETAVGISCTSAEYEMCTHACLDPGQVDGSALYALRPLHRL